MQFHNLKVLAGYNHPQFSPAIFRQARKEESLLCLLDRHGEKVRIFSFVEQAKLAMFWDCCGLVFHLFLAAILHFYKFAGAWAEHRSKL